MGRCWRWNAPCSFLRGGLAQPTSRLAWRNLARVSGSGTPSVGVCLNITWFEWLNSRCGVKMEHDADVLPGWAECADSSLEQLPWARFRCDNQVVPARASYPIERRVHRGALTRNSRKNGLNCAKSRSRPDFCRCSGSKSSIFKALFEGHRRRSVMIWLLSTAATL
jgi:hypothetical protein